MIGYKMLIGMIASTIILSALVIAGEPPASQPSTRREATTPYEGFAEDVERLRDIQRVPTTESRTVLASTHAAQAAARRIFSRVSFLHRDREEVLQMLGDPATISAYGKPAGEAASDPLVYVFDNGDAGFIYTLDFQNGHCVGVYVEFLE